VHRIVALAVTLAHRNSKLCGHLAQRPAFEAVRHYDRVPAVGRFFGSRCFRRATPVTLRGANDQFAHQGHRGAHLGLRESFGSVGSEKTADERISAQLSCVAEVSEQMASGDVKRRVGIYERHGSSL